MVSFHYILDSFCHLLLQLTVLLVIIVDLKSLINVELGRCVLLLDELRHCQVVECFIVGWI